MRADHAHHSTAKQMRFVDRSHPISA
jgi:hypothetical protein